MSDLALHPLINSDSSHYDQEGKTAIEEIEERLTVREMIGFCKGNMYKYGYRSEHKGQKASDLKKIETYKAYHLLLESMQVCTIGGLSVADTYKQLGMKLRYR